MLAPLLGDACETVLQQLYTGAALCTVWVLRTALSIYRDCSLSQALEIKGIRFSEPWVKEGQLADRSSD